MSQLKRTPLYDLHLELGGKMVPFAGYDMPVQYPLGIKKEHEWTRASCGLFDVSHMGQILLHGPRPAEALETLVCADIVSLPQGMQRYAIFTAQNGGILDDLMVANPGVISIWWLTQPARIRISPCWRWDWMTSTASKCWIAVCWHCKAPRRRTSCSGIVLPLAS